MGLQVTSEALIFLESLWEWFWWFSNTNFFSVIVTLGVGLAAYSIYTRQVNDIKINAASSILLELANASEIITKIEERIRVSDTLIDDVIIMPSNSWGKHKSLFLKDLTPIEWNSVNTFYHYAELIDESISYQKTFFEKNEEQYRANLQRVGAEMALGEKDLKKLVKKFADFYDRFSSLNNQQLLQRKTMWYQPQKPLLDVKLYIGNLNANIVHTPLYTKLESIANSKNNFTSNLVNILKRK